MNIDLKYLAAIVLVAMAAGAALSHQFMPREVTTTKLVDHDVIKDHIVTVTKEIVKPDGSKEIDTTVVDDRHETDTKKESIVDSKPIPQLKPNWFVTAGAGLDASSIRDLSNPVYQVGVNRRILGPIYVGAWGNTKSQVGIQLGLEF